MKKLARELQSKGRSGDTILAHINPEEAKLLKDLGGSGTINPDTGLPEFITTMENIRGLGDFENWKSGWLFNPSGGSGGGSYEAGGLSEDDIAFKKKLFEMFENLPDEFTKYTGNRYADMSPGEQSVLKNLQGGGGYQPLYDKATKDLGFSQDIMRGAADYDTTKLTADTQALMNPYEQSVIDASLADVSSAAAAINAQTGASALGLGAYGGTGAARAKQLATQPLLKQHAATSAGLRKSGYDTAMNQAMGLQQNRQGVAMNMAGLTGQELGFGVGGLDKKYTSQFSGYGQERAYKQQDLDFDFDQWQKEQGYDFQKLAFGGNLFSGMPYEQKQVAMQPASGGK